MNPALKIISIVFLLLSTANLTAQVTVTGHATAEVVEAVSASSGTHNLLSLQQNATPENLDLGSFTLCGGSKAICSVVVNSAHLTGDHGTKVNFTACTRLSNETGIMNEQGTTVLNFKGNTGPEIMDCADKTYEGNYSVVFAYN